MTDYSDTQRDHQHDPAPSWGAILRAMNVVREQNYEVKHLKTARTTWDTAVATIDAAPAGSPVSLYGIPVFIDNDLPHGRWEVGAGRRPEPDTEYQEASA